MRRDIRRARRSTPSPSPSPPAPVLLANQEHLVRQQEAGEASASSGAWTEEAERKQAKMEGRKGESFIHGGGSPSPQAHLSSDAHAAAAEVGRAARCARGVARQPASRPAAAEENLLNKWLQRAGRAARGGGGPATARLLGVSSHFLLSPRISGSRIQDRMIIAATATLSIHFFFSRLL